MGKSLILAVKIIGDAKSAIDSMNETATRSEKLQATWKKAVQVSAVVVGGLIAVGKSLETAGEAASTSRARIEQVATSMSLFGDDTAVVTDRLIDVANKMAMATAIDPNAIKQAQATLMTFRDVAQTADEVGGTFERATQASADLAGAGFGTIESASVMLGKALGDPTRGLTALSRVGVQFTEQEKEQIRAMQEAGDVAGAQAVILQGVEKQVGGVAEATADSSDKQRIAWQLTREEIGEKLLPVFEKLRDFGMSMAGWVAENSDLVIGLAAGIGTLAAGVLIIAGAMKVWAAIQTIQTALQWANNAAWLASPITWIIIAIIAAIAILVTIIVLVVQNWDAIKAAGVAAWEAIIGWVKQAISWLGDKITAPIRAAMDWFENLKRGAIIVFASIITKVQEVIQWLKDLAGNVLPGWAKDLFGMSARMTVTPELATLSTPGYSARMSVTPDVQSFAAPMPAPATEYAPLAYGNFAAMGGLLTALTAPMMRPQAAPVIYEDNRRYEINLPNYLGDKREVMKELRDALKKAGREDERLITA